MIHDIGPYKFQNEFTIKKPDRKDYVLYYNGNSILLKNSLKSCYLQFLELEEQYPHIYSSCEYLFAIDNRRFYLFQDENIIENESFQLKPISTIHHLNKNWEAFVGITGYHIYNWKNSRKFCGKCGKPMINSNIERALICSECGIIEYPRISPAVIVAVVDQDRLLLSKYAGSGEKNYALLAGYVEVGESMEDTVNREIMEEVGLKVKNFKYYKSQPWSFSETLLTGFFVELDGLDEIHLDFNELSEATWFHRNDLPQITSKLSLTGEMIEMFRKGVY